jgi:hypothetical protein
MVVYEQQRKSIGISLWLVQAERGVKQNRPLLLGCPLEQLVTAV